MMRRVNDMLRDLCEKLLFMREFITNYLWKIGVYLQEMGTHILSNHFLKFLNIL